MWKCPTRIKEAQLTIGMSGAAAAVALDRGPMRATVMRVREGPPPGHPHHREFFSTGRAAGRVTTSGGASCYPAQPGRDGACLAFLLLAPSVPDVRHHHNQRCCAVSSIRTTHTKDGTASAGRARICKSVKLHDTTLTAQPERRCVPLRAKPATSLRISAYARLRVVWEISTAAAPPPATRAAQGGIPSPISIQPTYVYIREALRE